MSNSPVCNVSGSEDAKGSSSKLESSTKEELIKLIKKLMLTNQKSKAKCEELSKENESLRVTLAKKSESQITADQWECMLMKQTSIEAAYQSTVDELNNIIHINKDLESQISTLNSVQTEMQKELDALRCTNDTLARNIETERRSRSDLEEKLFDWEKMMKMLEKERDDALFQLVEVRGTCESNVDVVEGIIRSVESVIPDRDVLSEIDSSADLHQSKEERKVDVHSDFFKMEENLVKRLTYLNSITASLVFERDEIKERIHHFAASEIFEPLSSDAGDVISVESGINLIDTLAKIEVSMKSLKQNLSHKTNELNLANDKLRELSEKCEKISCSETSQPCTDHVQRIIQKSEQNKLMVVYGTVDSVTEEVKLCNTCLDGFNKIESLQADVSKFSEEGEKYLLKISTLEGQLSSTKGHEAEIFSLRSENERLSSQLDVSNEQLLIKDQELSESIRKLKEDLSIKDNLEIDNLKIEKSKLEERIKQLEMDLQNQNFTSRKENERSGKTEIDDFVTEACILPIEDINIDDENISAANEMVCAGDSMQDKNNLNDEILKLKEEAERLKSTFDAEKILLDEIKQKEVNDLLEKVSLLKLHLQEESNENISLQLRLNESLENLELQNKCLHERLEKATKELEILEEANSENMELKYSLEKLLSEKESILQENLVLKSEKLELQTSCSDMDSTLSMLNSELTELKENLNVTRLEKSAIQKDFDDARTELEFIQNNFLSSKSDLEATRVKLESALSDLISTKTDSDLIQRESEYNLNELRSEKDLLENQLTSVTMEVDCIKAALEKTKLELMSTKSDLESSLCQLEKTNLKLEKAELQSSADLNELESTFNQQLEFTKAELDSTRIKFDSELDSLLDICGCLIADNEGLNFEEKLEKLKNYLEMHLNERTNYGQLKEELDIALKQSKNLEEILEAKEKELDDLKTTTESETMEFSELSTLKMKLKEKEDREAKIKQLVIKNKKEIFELNKKLEMTSAELEQVKSESSNRKASDQTVSLLYQNLQSEYESLEASFDLEKIKSHNLQKSIDQLNFELCQAKVKVAEAAEKIDNLKEEMNEKERLRQLLEEAKMQDEKEIQAGKIQRDVISKENMLLESKVNHLESQLRQAHEERQSEEKRLEQEMKVKLHELENARKDAQHSQVMGLEIADYERTVRSLNVAIKEKEEKIKSLQEELQHAHQQRNATAKLLEASENQFRQSEEQSSKMKQMLLKLRKDLADARRQEGERATNESQLRTQNEILIQLTEEQKLKIADLILESRQISDRLAIALENHQRTATLMETKLANQQKEAELNKLALNKLQADYDGYKVRVHSVLKLKKNNSFDETALADEKREKERLEQVNAQLKAKLQDLTGQLSLVTAEGDQLREEQEKMIQKQMDIKSKFEAAEQIWKEKLEKCASDHAADHAKQLETIQELMTQNESMARTFKEQHACVVESLKNQLDKAQLEVDRCRTRLQSLDPSPTNQSTNGGAPNKSITFIPLSGASEERQAAEGSENGEDVQNAAKLVASSIVLHPSNQSFVPLEVLLSQSSNVPSEAADEDLQKDEKEEMLNSALVASQRQGCHLRQLLNESEATVLRLTEQAGILKAEIRRLERNEERQSSVSNMEYLKNVVYKFLTLRSVEERLQLVPVMQTMLKLSPEEKERITSIANDPIGGSGGEASGWSSYIKWPGLK